MQQAISMVRARLRCTLGMLCRMGSPWSRLLCPMGTPPASHLTLRATWRSVSEHLPSELPHVGQSVFTLPLLLAPVTHFASFYGGTAQQIIGCCSAA